MVRRLQGHARPDPRDRQADDRPDQRDRRRRRQRAADGVRPRGDRRRRLHPPRRARARLRPGRRRDAVAPADGRRPPRARDRPPLRRDPRAQAAEWGLVNRAVPAAELDAVVDAWVESLVRKLPQTTRYAKQQLNVWRDMAWHQTVGHARDWLSLSMLGDEAQGAITAFLDSRRGRTARGRLGDRLTRMADEVLTRRDGAVLTITFNRPEVYNAFNRELHAALHEALTEAADDSVRAVVITGAGKGFCAGQDLKEFGSVSDSIGDALEQTYHPNVRARPVAREAGHRGGQRAGGGSRPLVRLRLRPSCCLVERDLRPGLHRHRPRPGRRRHVVRPPAPRLRAGVRVDVHEPSALGGRGARLGARLRGDRRGRVRGPRRGARGGVGCPPDARDRPDEAALRARLRRRRSTSSSRSRRSSSRSPSAPPTSRRASTPSSRSARPSSPGPDRQRRACGSRSSTTTRAASPSASSRAGRPPLEGATILERRRFALEQARPRAAASRLRAARARGHVRLPRRPAERRRRRPRRRLLPQRGLLDGLRARDDRARHVGARRRRARATRGRQPRRRRRPVGAPRDVGDRRGRPGPVGALPERALVRVGAGRRGRRARRRRRVRRRLLRVAARSGSSPPSCRA